MSEFTNYLHVGKMKWKLFVLPDPREGLPLLLGEPGIPLGACRGGRLSRLRLP